MADAFTLCEECGTPIGSSENAHQAHELGCERALQGWCRCDGWVCLRCCPDEECTPLQERLKAARDEVIEAAEAWEAAQHAPASTEPPAAAVPSIYLGWTG